MAGRVICFLQVGVLADGGIKVATRHAGEDVLDVALDATLLSSRIVYVITLLSEDDESVTAKWEWRR